MKTLFRTASFAMRRRGGAFSGSMDRKPWIRLHYRWPATMLCLTAALVLGSLPAASSGATRHHVSSKASQKAWWSYLPGSYLHRPASKRKRTHKGRKSGSGHTHKPGSGGTPAPRPLPGPGSLTMGTFTNSSGTRTYQMYIPTTYKAGAAVPLVVALHGCTETADSYRQLSQWDKLAQQKGFIVVFPQQGSSDNYLECWNWFLQPDMSRGSGEPAIIAGITNWVQQHYSVDRARTYVAGFSAGGAMTSVMAATYPDVYAAAGVGDGCEYAATPQCAGYQSADPTQAGQAAYTAMGSHARMMPVIAFQGDQDQVVPPANGQQLVQQWQATDGLVAHTTLSTWPKSSYGWSPGGGRTYTVSSYSDPSGHDLIDYWVVHGMGHAWSGGSSTAQYSDPSGPDETAAMYAFFLNHPMG